MTQKTVAEQIEELVPKSIDDIIRLNRDKASLRFSTKEDLAPLSSEISTSARAVPVSRWNLVTFWRRHVPQDVFLLGWNDDEDRTWNTSPVRRYDAKTGLIITRSGTLYLLSGPQGKEGDLDLLHLCIYLRISGFGDHYGIPPFFY